MCVRGGTRVRATVGLNKNKGENTMGYKVCAFQNVSGFSGEVPTIYIDETDPNWDEIYETWKSGANPTPDPKWKKGVFALTKKI